MLKVIVLFAVIACGGSPAPKPSTTPTGAEKTLVLVDDKGVGLTGLDPVSYFTGEPAAGSDAATASHGGATYWFASPEHKATFEGDKPKYAPQFGGYCAFAAAQNRLSTADPRVFLIHEGQLLMFTNADFKQQFEADSNGNKAKADANWPGLVAMHGK